MNPYYLASLPTLTQRLDTYQQPLNINPHIASPLLGLNASYVDPTNSMSLSYAYPTSYAYPIQIPMAVPQQQLMHPLLNDSRSLMDASMASMQMPQSVSNYLDKQNQLKLRIQRHVFDYQKMEEIKQKELHQRLNTLNMMVGPGGLDELNALFQPLQPLSQYQDQNSSYLGMNNSQSPTKRKNTNPVLEPLGKSKLGDISYFGDADANLSVASKAYSYPSHPELMPFIPKSPTLSPLKLASPKVDSPSKFSTPKEERVPRQRLQKKINHEKGVRLLRVFMWKLALPGLWSRSVKIWAAYRRQKELKAFNVEMVDSLEVFLEFAGSSISKQIKNLVTEKKSMVIVQPPNQPPLVATELDRRYKTIAGHLKTILEYLRANLNSGQLPKTFFRFLAKVSEDDGVVPEDFLAKFEVDRLCFNTFGNLKNMDEWKSKMVLAVFVLIKGVLSFLIMRSWKVITIVQENQVNIKNIFNLGSIFYHLILDVISENVPTEHNTVIRPPFIPEAPSMSALDPEYFQKLDVLPEDNHNDKNEIIHSFYSRDLLKQCLDERSALTKEVKEEIKNFLEALYNLTHQSLEPNWHVKQAFAKYRP